MRILDKSTILIDFRLMNLKVKSLKGLCHKIIDPYWSNNATWALMNLWISNFAIKNLPKNVRKSARIVVWPFLRVPVRQNSGQKSLDAVLMRVADVFSLHSGISMERGREQPDKRSSNFVSEYLCENEKCACSIFICTVRVCAKVGSKI